MNGLHVDSEQGWILVNVRRAVFYICSGPEQDISYIEMREERANVFFLPLEKHSRNEKNVAAKKCGLLYYNLTTVDWEDTAPLISQDF